jgi:hypothetical protein
METKDLCPICTQLPGINIANHMRCISLANLGPADPRERSWDFWQFKQAKWGVDEGVARTRLCMNCEHYEDTQENQDCIATGPGAKVQASALPITPRWADIGGMPSAVCSRYDITCSALRTCDDWEPCCNPDMEDM